MISARGLQPSLAIRTRKSTTLNSITVCGINLRLIEGLRVSTSAVRRRGKVCPVWYEEGIFATLVLIQGSPFARKKAAMENYRAEELRVELNQLLRKQTEVLESRSFGVASDTEILEYEIRQEIIHDICNELANAAAA